MRQTISSQGTEWVHCSVTVDGAAPDPLLVVEFAFTTSRPTTATVWHTGQWDEGLARILVGPGAGGLRLTPGSYQVNVRVHAEPEHVVKTCRDPLIIE